MSTLRSTSCVSAPWRGMTRESAGNDVTQIYTSADARGKIVISCDLADGRQFRMADIPSHLSGTPTRARRRLWDRRGAAMQLALSPTSVYHSTDAKVSDARWADLTPAFDCKAGGSPWCATRQDGRPQSALRRPLTQSF